MKFANVCGGIHLAIAFIFFNLLKNLVLKDERKKIMCANASKNIIHIKKKAEI